MIEKNNRTNLFSDFLTKGARVIKAVLSINSIFVKVPVLGHSQKTIVQLHSSLFEKFRQRLFCVR